MKRTNLRMMVILSLAVCGLALSSDFTTASANILNGKCCRTSDHGRSLRYRMAVSRIGAPRSCSTFAANCAIAISEKGYPLQLCQAAKSSCLRTGVYVGPLSGYVFAKMQRR